MNEWTESSWWIRLINRRKQEGHEGWMTVTKHWCSTDHSSTKDQSAGHQPCTIEKGDHPNSRPCHCPIKGCGRYYPSAPYPPAKTETLQYLRQARHASWPGGRLLHTPPSELVNCDVSQPPSQVMVCLRAGSIRVMRMLETVHRSHIEIHSVRCFMSFKETSVCVCVCVTASMCPTSTTVPHLPRLWETEITIICENCKIKFDFILPDITNTAYLKKKINKSCEEPGDSQIRQIYIKKNLNDSPVHSLVFIYGKILEYTFSEKILATLDLLVSLCRKETRSWSTGGKESRGAPDAISMHWFTGK